MANDAAAPVVPCQSNKTILCIYKECQGQCQGLPQCFHRGSITNTVLANVSFLHRQGPVTLFDLEMQGSSSAFQRPH